MNAKVYDHESPELRSAESVAHYVLDDRFIPLERHVIPPIPPFETIKITVYDATNTDEIPLHAACPILETQAPENVAPNVPEWQIQDASTKSSKKMVPGSQ